MATLKVFGNQPMHAELQSYRQAADNLASFVVDLDVQPLFAIVNAPTLEGARAVIRECRDSPRVSEKNLRVITVQPWRYARNAEDLRTALVAHLIAQTEPTNLGRGGRDISEKRREKVNELYKWLGERVWSPVMQTELDAWLDAWLTSLDGRGLLLVVEGLDECDEREQRLCREVLYKLLTYPNVVLLRDAESNGKAVVDWPGNVAIEVPPLSPRVFDEFILKLWTEAGIVSGDDSGRLRSWARIVRDIAYPDAARARRIVNDTTMACIQALWQLERKTSHVPLERLGQLTNERAPLAKIMFMVLLAHRFPELADALQSSVNGADIVIRLALWSRSSSDLTAAEAEDIRRQYLGRLVDQNLTGLVGDGAVARFFRDCFAGDEPLVEVLGGRHEWSSYLWVGRGPRVDASLQISKPSILSLEWMRERLSVSLADGNPQSIVETTNRLRDSDDWELMGELALVLAERRPVPRQAEELARLGVARARRANDDAGELRARGALAVVLARGGQIAEAEQQLLLAGEGKDAIDGVRLNEFRALVRENHDAVKASDLWKLVLRGARVIGLDDIAARAAGALVRLAKPAGNDAGPTRGNEERCRVFVSYRHVDGRVAGAVKSALDDLGNCDVFYDDKIQGATSWLATIGEELQAADIAVMLISKAFVSRRAGGSSNEEADDICYVEAMRIEERRQKGVLRLVHANLDGVGLPSRLMWTHGPIAEQRSWPRTERNFSGALTDDEISDLARSVAADVARIAAELFPDGAKVATEIAGGAH